LRAPFPWFGGKSRVSHLVWPRFGDPLNYVEPFAGSLAVMLGRPTIPRTETVNDKDCFLANFWRALQADPAGVAKYADWPVNEADLHSRHIGLVNDGMIITWRCYDDPDFYDVKVAGWWVWGISCWIGNGWCTIRRALQDCRPHLMGDRRVNAWNNRPHLTWDQGIQRVSRQKPHVAQGSRGIISDEVLLQGVEHRRPRNKAAGVDAKRPNLTTEHGYGIHAKQLNVHQHGVVSRRPNIDGWSDRGIHAKRPDISGRHGCLKGIHRGVAGTCAERTANIREYLQLLADRLRNVRVCCGDWSRVCTKAVTWGMGTTGVLLDPPYPHEAKRDRDIYAADDYEVAHQTHNWAVANGDNPKLRIAFCGYEGTHDFPPAWDCMAWKAQGGYANRSDKQGRKNAKRERIWFSPHCLPVTAGPLFEVVEHA
ncbi:MAG TPA: hypothetical protein VM223_05000, partial [Planctomycetota bacterium]|nr:hypothetical protein [Planctomycetota bacterium]